MSRIVTPTRESLQMAIDLVLSGKAPTDQLIPSAALLDGYLSGIVAVDLSFDEKGRPVVQINEGQQPEGADGDGRDESVADGGFRSPTDAELQERGFPELIESRAVHFLCNLPDNELELISRDGMGSILRGILARLARNEIERRRDA